MCLPSSGSQEQLELQREGLQRQRRKSVQASFETLKQIIQFNEFSIAKYRVFVGFELSKL